ncbi:MAG: sodium:proton antiporter, partial [Verrucomicrobiota bacterium]
RKPEVQQLPASHQCWSRIFRGEPSIGNGPNFMVKAIADHNKIHTPSFLGFVFKYTLPYMMPMLIIIWWLFFRS